MSAEEVKRTYNFEDARLSTEATRIKNLVIRDSKEFKTRNIGDSNVTALQAAIDNFDGYATDEELQGDVTEAVAKKDERAAAIREQVRPIRSMAELLYKKGGKYRAFGFSGMDKLDDNNLYRLALRVVRVGKKLLAELAAKGLTMEMLEVLSQTAVLLHDAIEDVSETEETRDIATQERIMLGNALYALVVELASVGKSLFEDRDEARYNDYVLYNETSGGTPPGTTCLMQIRLQKP